MGCQTARGAILIFLLLQITNTAEDVTETVGVRNPWTEYAASRLSGFLPAVEVCSTDARYRYVKFLPSVIPLPTFWSEAEKALLQGTSLATALPAKLKSLDREFQELRSATESIPWCKRQWWDEETGRLTLEDWKVVDAMCRSRALEMPGAGDVMVPCLDMVNHASGEETVAVTVVDNNNGDGMLLLRGGKRMGAGEEITITYGDDKGACEMIFSYGFLEQAMCTARALFLELEVPDDDPLKRAKIAVSTAPPGIKLYMEGESIEWEGPLVWLICVNEEDGLEFKMLRKTDGENDLEVLWNGAPLQDTSKLVGLLEKEPLWEVYQLRAVTILQSRIKEQLLCFSERPQDLADIPDVDTSVLHTITRLRKLEMGLLEAAYEEFEKKSSELIETETVRRYLEASTLQEATCMDEDFS